MIYISHNIQLKPVLGALLSGYHIQSNEYPYLLTYLRGRPFLRMVFLKRTMLFVGGWNASPLHFELGTTTILSVPLFNY